MNNRVIILFIFVVFSLALIATGGYQNANSESMHTTDDLLNKNEFSNELDNQSYASNELEASKGKSSNKNSVSISDKSVSIETNADSQASVNNSDSTISVKIESNNSTSAQSTPQSPTEQPSLLINGEKIDLPKSGRVNQTHEDGDTKTRLRADIDSDGNSSLSISTNSND
jgi:hypothetical protein